ncbi:MAG: AAA family ATPase [Epsilonproteobacteria bacterium]|nr:MAG: AAA family ATPase [Campylobacterota bacterium]
MKQKLSSEFIPIIDAIERDLVGKRHVIALTLAAYFAGGHVLLEDIPGVGKTTLAKSFAQVMGLDFGRIQFTSDLLPSDILGLSYFDQKKSDFILRKGAIFTQFLLADEINRSMPKTQSALLEAMEEHSVTIDGVSHKLPEPFFVIGTQNPHEEVGTFPLPHSQLDRFICSFGIGYPDKISERRVLLGIEKAVRKSDNPSLGLERIKVLIQQASEIKLSDAMLDYLQDIILFTRESNLFDYGLSTRGALALTAMLKSWAMLHGRNYATPDDLQAVVSAVCSHRLQFVEGVTTAKRIEDALFSHTRSDA